MSDAGESDGVHDEQQSIMTLLGGIPAPQPADDIPHDSADADEPGPDEPGIPQHRLPPPDSTYAHESAHHYNQAAAAAAAVQALTGGVPVAAYGQYPQHQFPSHMYAAPPPQPPAATKPKPKQTSRTAAASKSPRQRRQTNPQNGNEDGEEPDGDEDGDEYAGEDPDDSGDEYLPEEVGDVHEPDPDEPAHPESRSRRRNPSANPTARKTRPRRSAANQTSIDETNAASQSPSQVVEGVNGHYDSQPVITYHHPESLPPPPQLPHPNYHHQPAYPAPHFPTGDPYAGLATQSSLSTLQTQSQTQLVGDDSGYSQFADANGEDDGGSGVKPRRQRKHQNDEEWNRQRKDNHKEVERRRRSNINQGINDLAAIVPNSSAGEKAKGAILTRAVQYIQSLKENEARNIEKWTLEKLLMDQAMGDLQNQVEELRRRWEMEMEARVAFEREVEVLKARLAATGNGPENAELGQKRPRVE